MDGRPAHAVYPGWRWRALAASLGTFALGGGLISLLGWFTGTYRLTDWSGSGISMKANAAIAAGAAGAGLILLALRPQFRSAVRILATFVALVGGLTLLEHITGSNLGIDTLLFEERAGARATAAPGRMGPPASLSFVLLGTGIGLMSLGHRARAVAAALALTTTAISLLSLTGYLYGAELMYSAPRLTGISVQAASMVFALGVGLLVSAPEQQPLRVLLESSAAGILARRVFPLIILLPIGLGWLQVMGQSADWYDAAFGSAIQTLLEVTLLAVLLGWSIAKVRSYEIAVREGEGRLTETLAHITDGFVTFDRQWQYTFVNDEATRLMGKSRSELLGKVAWEVFPETVGSLAHRELLRAAASRSSVEYEDFHPALQRWFANKAYPAADGGLAVYFHDITRSKEVEAALLSKERQLQHVTDNAAVMVTQCLRDLRYVYVNKTYADFFGRGMEEIVGRPIPEILGAEVFTTIHPYIERVLAGERVEFECRFPQSVNDTRWIRAVYVPDHDAEGTICGWIAAMTDITERKQAEEALREADARKDEFLATLAHELRNPLAPVMNSLELLQRLGSQEPIATEAIGMMGRQIAHMVRLIDDLLDVSRISRGKIELKKQPIELSSVVQDAVATARLLAKGAEQEIDLILPDEPVILDADSARLNQVFGNLLNNACRYTDRGGRIQVTAERQGSDAVVSVKDTGIGIPPEKLDDIFRMFSQVDRSLERTAGGLGIGLHLVKELVEMHGGSVVARSNGLSQGSEFVVRLPVALTRSEPDHVTGPPLDIPPPPPRRVLVVDDNLDSAKTLSMLLKTTGHETQLAHDGLEAVDQAVAFEPDVILLDLGLPKLNGFEACRAIREKLLGKPTLIVAITGWGQDEDRRKSKAAGFDEHLVKPIDHAALTKLLREWQPVPADA